jgi:hypothetical protein
MRGRRIVSTLNSGIGIAGLARWLTRARRNRVLFPPALTDIDVDCSDHGEHSALLTAPHLDA